MAPAVCRPCLADFRPTDNSQDFLLSDWKYFDLSGLGDAQTLYFNVSSSDSGLFGMSTPGYFAIDDILMNRSSPVPEPGSLMLLLSGCLALGCVRGARRRR